MNDTMNNSPLRKSMWIITGLLVSLIVTGCAAGTGATVVNTNWMLEAINGTSVLAADVMITANFTEDQVGGNSGCNTYSGGFEVDGSELRMVGPVMSTMMACLDNNLMELEAQYLGILQNSQSFEISGDTLTIISGDGSTLRFVAQ